MDTTIIRRAGLVIAAVVLAALSMHAQTFAKYDTSTQGSWQGVYGASGASAGPNQLPTLPSSQLAISNASTWTWAGLGTSDKRGLVTASGARIGATWYNTSFSITVNFTGQVSFYLCDWDSMGRIEQIKAGGDTRQVANFTQGEYVVYNVSGTSTFTFSTLAGPNAVVLGVFLDSGGGSVVVTPPVTTPPVTTPPTCPAPPAPVHGVVLAWNNSTVGATGYTVSRGTVSGGPYTQIGGTVSAAMVPNPSYTDTTVQGGHTYYYVTDAITPTGTSGYSAQIPITIPSP